MYVQLVSTGRKASRKATWSVCEPLKIPKTYWDQRTQHYATAAPKAWMTDAYTYMRPHYHIACITTHPILNRA